MTLSLLFFSICVIGSASGIAFGEVKKSHVDAPNVMPFIVGGVETKPGDWKSTVFIHDMNLTKMTHVFFMCGGSLISTRYVLTSALCIDRVSSYANPVVSTGRHFVLTDDSEQEIIIEDYYLHPLFKATPRINDIAIVKLVSEARITSRVKPVSFGLEVNPGSTCFMVGYGINGTGGGNGLHSVLTTERQAPASIITNSACRTAVANITGRDRVVINENVTCSRDSNFPKRVTACGGDLGSPLFCQDPNDKSWRLAGVISSYGPLSARCETSYGYPTVYTKVSPYASWIRSITGVDMTSSSPNTSNKSYISMVCLLAFTISYVKKD